MHLIILYSSFICSNTHYYSLAWVEQIIFAWMEQQLIMSWFVSLFLPRDRNYTSFSPDLRWPNTWEEMMPTPRRKPTIRKYTELTKFCHKLNILHFCNIYIYYRNVISCKAVLQRLYCKKRYTNNLEFNLNRMKCIFFLFCLNIIFFHLVLPFRIYRR